MLGVVRVRRGKQRGERGSKRESETTEMSETTRMRERKNTLR